MNDKNTTTERTQFGETFTDSKGFDIKVQTSYSDNACVLILCYQKDQAYTTEPRLNKEQAQKLIDSLKEFIES